MPTESEQQFYTNIVARFAGQRVLVIGDLMLDEFIWGRVSRISPEAPVPVVNVTGESYYPGGAANVARNLREFTPHTSLMGLTGADAAGERLCGLLQASGIDTAGIQRDADCSTIVKTRIIARNQQVVRVDRERPAPLTARQLARAEEDLAAAIAQVDGVVVADYGKGLLNQELAGYICRTARARGKVLTVDPHPHTSLVWPGATAVKPNRVEAFSAAGMPLTEPVEPVTNDQPLWEAARKLQRAWDTASLLVTLGEQGMLLFHGDDPPYHTPTRAREVFDVSGAGDTAIAVFTLGLLAGAAPWQAAELANRASGIVVGKLGTATVSLAELQASFR
jgi:D-beta-D-heptose 7-phosphate kinase/D-beta-D-heptose 1-phosphate adenosyltransferase